MKENIEDKVITLADGKTANNLRGAALIGTGIGDCGVAHDYCGWWNPPCCEGKFICLKIGNPMKSISFYLIHNIVRKTLLLFFRLLLRWEHLFALWRIGANA